MGHILASAATPEAARDLVLGAVKALEAPRT
jgi:hypothetical protein